MRNSGGATMTMVTWGSEGKEKVERKIVMGGDGFPAWGNDTALEAVS